MYCKFPDDISYYKTGRLESACLSCENSVFALYLGNDYKKQIECFCRLKHTNVDYTIVICCDGAEQNDLADCIAAIKKCNEIEQQRITSLLDDHR